MSWVKQILRKDSYSENTAYGDNYYEDIYYSDDYYEDNYYGDNYYEDNYYGDNYYEDIYFEDTYIDNYSTGTCNDVIGIWSNEESTIAIYDTGYAEVKSGYQSADFRWVASDTMITLDPYNRLEYEPVSMYYEIYGNTIYFTIDDVTEVFYGN